EPQRIRFQGRGLVQEHDEAQRSTGGPEGYLQEPYQGPHLLEPLMSTRNILITGGAGFIGSHVVRRFVTKYPQYRIVNLDALTYAGNLENLRDVENAPNYTFVKADIRDAEALRK